MTHMPRGVAFMGQPRLVKVQATLFIRGSHYDRHRRPFRFRSADLHGIAALWKSVRLIVGSCNPVLDLPSLPTVQRNGADHCDQVIFNMVLFGQDMHPSASATTPKANLCFWIAAVGHGTSHMNESIACVVAQGGRRRRTIMFSRA